jgi:nitric oxide reductase subunit C
MSPVPWGEHTSGRKMVAYGMTGEEADNLVAYFTWIGNIDLNGFPAKPKYKIEAVK